MCLEGVLASVPPVTAISVRKHGNSVLHKMMMVQFMSDKSGLKRGSFVLYTLESLSKAQSPACILCNYVLLRAIYRQLCHC